MKKSLFLLFSMNRFEFTVEKRKKANNASLLGFFFKYANHNENQNIDQVRQK